MINDQSTNSTNEKKMKGKRDFLFVYNFNFICRST